MRGFEYGVTWEVELSEGGWTPWERTHNTFKQAEEHKRDLESPAASIHVRNVGPIRRRSITVRVGDWEDVDGPS